MPRQSRPQVGFHSPARRTARAVFPAFCSHLESSLTKGQFRILDAFRKSRVPAIADEAFAKWLDQAVEASETDKNAGRISDVLRGLVQDGKPSIHRGGYIVRRGRGRLTVETA